MAVRQPRARDTSKRHVQAQPSKNPSQLGFDGFRYGQSKAVESAFAAFQKLPHAVGTRMGVLEFC
jgi:hypothetical protein